MTDAGRMAGFVSQPRGPSHDGRIPGVGATLPYPIKAGITRVRSLAWLARSRGALDLRGPRILMYHRVSDDEDELAVPPGRFRRHMDFLAEAGFAVLDVPTLGGLLANGETPRRTIGLSFDDGYRDIAEHALPVLAERGFRATVFVTTGVTAGRALFAWYRRQPPLLSWDEIVSLDRGGVIEFEAHTVSHPNLLVLDDEAAATEIGRSKSELEEQLGREVTTFSYPAGLFGPRERQYVVDAGYRFAVSCEPGVNLPTTDRFALRRRQIDARDQLLDFRAKVGGGHDSPLPMRGTYRRLRYGEGKGRPRWASSRR